MMQKALLVILAALMLLQQASGKGGIEINLNIGGNAGESGTSDKSQDAVIAGLLKQAHQDTTGNWAWAWPSQQEILDIADTSRDMLIAMLLAQNKEQGKDLADLKNQVKTLTLDLCRTKQGCCNKTTPCPSGYEWFCEKPDKCYKFSNNTAKKTYSYATSVCQNDGGRLAMPKDKETNDFLVQQMKTRYHGTTTWFGLTDVQSDEGIHTWVWEDGKTLGTGAWHNWKPGSQTWYTVLVARGSDLVCAHWAPSWSPDLEYMWDATICTDLSNYICEVEATSVP